MQPLGWADDLPELQKEEIELSTRAKGVVSDIDGISEELSGIVIDDRLLRLAERIDLSADSRARFVTAEKDLPERQLQLRDVDVAITGILARMDCGTDVTPNSLLLGATATGALRELMEERSGIEAGVETAGEELVEAQQQLAEAQANLTEAGGQLQSEAPSTVSQLASAVSLARSDDSAARRPS